MKVLEGRENDQPDIPAPDAPGKVAVPESMEESPRDLPDDEKQERREAAAELRQKADGVDEMRKFEAPRDELARFNPERAGLPAISADDVAEYLAEHRSSRPWLAVVDSASPEVQRIFVALDSAGGHAHIRHEGWATEEANRRRVAYLEDPAQLDPGKRDLGIDGLRRDDHQHRCADITTRITDAAAFATAFARGTEHPSVRQALDMPFDPDKAYRAVTVPISDVLGSGGHQYCTGWRLEPVDGDGHTAHINRGAWRTARSEGRPPEVPEPEASPVRTFEGGVIKFLVVANQTEKCYEILTMYVDPPGNDDQKGA